jgi:putative SOS response-associated peptidase YedK
MVVHMCGRFAAFSKAEDIADALGLQTLLDGARLLPPSWNVAPTSTVRIATKETLDVARWGLIPPWGNPKSVLFNARIETVAEKPSYKQAFSARRCLVPVNGYYEWQSNAHGKQPFFITADDGGGLFFAGIYNEGEQKSVAILTMEAVPVLADIHHRTPVAFTPDDAEAWLRFDISQPEEIVATAVQEFSYVPVSKEVGSVAHNYPELIEPLTPEPTLF